MEFLDSIWAMIMSLFGSFDNMLKELINFDQLAIDFYTNVISPYPEWAKILGALGLVVVIIFGVLSIAKKMLKLVIFIAVILAILVFSRILMS